MLNSISVYNSKIQKGFKYGKDMIKFVFQKDHSGFWAQLATIPQDSLLPKKSSDSNKLFTAKVKASLLRL